MMIGEICLNYDKSQTIFFWFSSCSGIPFLWEEAALIYNMQSVTIVTMLIITFGCNLIIYVRKRQLEKVRAGVIMIVNYSLDGIMISRRREDEPSSHALKNFNRTVVTPKASFFGFLVNAVHYLIFLLLYLNVTSPGPPVLGQFFLFLQFSVMFSLNISIETILSPSLKNSVIEFFPCFRHVFRHTYHDVNV